MLAGVWFSSSSNPKNSMKFSLAKLLCLFAVAGLALPTLNAGAEFLLAPLARAFGAPPESELARCRQAFQGLQGHLGTSRVVVAPVYFVNGHQRSWSPELAAAICREAATRTGAKFTVAAAKPQVGPAKLGHNQLRYLWDRAGDYSGWVKSAPPGGDYVWLVEIWGHDGRVGAIHVYVLDPTGQVAYCRLFNSHHFGDNFPLEGGDAVRLIVDDFFRNLARDPKVIFPPYGVG